MELRQTADWRRLEPLANKWSAWDPKSALPWIMAAEAAKNLEAPARVANYLENLPNDDPRTPELLLELATIYFGKLNMPDSGVRACQRALELKPDHAEAHRRLLFYYGITLQRTRILDQAHEAISLGGDRVETYVYLIGANWLVFSNAYELNDKWLRSGVDTEIYAVAKTLHWRGTATTSSTVQAIDEVDAERAKRAEHTRMVRKLLQRYPDNPELLAYMLEQESLSGNVQEVEELLAQVPASSANDNRFWHYKGWLHATRNELQEAEDCFRKALELHQYAWRSYFELANVLRKLNRFEEVEEFNRLSVTGKRLRETILQLPDVQSVPIDVFREMKDYAEACGDAMTAARMSERLTELESHP